MFESRETFNPGSAASFITMLIIGMVLIGSVMIPFILDTSVETVESDNGIGAGVPLAKATDDSVTTSIWIYTTSPGEVVFAGDYIGSTAYTNQIILLSDVLAVFIDGQKVSVYRSSTNVITTVYNALELEIDNGKINNLDYEWIYYPSNDGEYKSYIPPIKYENGEVAALGIFQSNAIISKGDTVSVDNIPYEVTVSVQKSKYGIRQVYYTWSD